MPNIHRAVSLSLGTVLLSCFLSTPAHAGAQQDKMRACNKEAREKGLKKDERKAFMSSCLSSAAPSSQSAPAPAEDDKSASLQEHRKQCRADAKEKALKGDERKAFLAECSKA